MNIRRTIEEYQDLEKGDVFLSVDFFSNSFDYITPIAEAS
ncbi:hypothetical protein Mucpa_2599 [Mucilaginibacter paludis DSM 18603]|uniref:Uncharacterized protein n=1 Tax=Mucilaginibacter paludis DSM 18603 TaxID=714943 RepID=H1Y257_9SPHI|nr:hypothetical protein Mucpa_2599 [Mucilaginibacter paludis DSM 18603]